MDEREKPMRLRFFAEEGVDVCVWGDEEDADETQRTLPIPPELAQRMTAWIVEFNERTQERRPGPWTSELAVDHDLRGLALSRELQEALGPAYEVVYSFTTTEGRTRAGAERQNLVPRAPHGARLAELLRTAAVLALPADQQLAWARARGGPESPDALVIDLYETRDDITSFEAAGWLSRRAATRLSELADMVEKLGADDPAAWSPSGLASAQGWERVREHAREVLRLL